MYQPRGRGGSRRGRENATANNKTTKVPLKGLFSDGVWKCNCDPRLPAQHFQTKNGGKNHGRWFYTCQHPQPKRCDFFLWGDEAKAREAAAVLNNSRTEPGALESDPVTPRKSIVGSTGLMTPQTGGRPQVAWDEEAIKTPYSLNNKETTTNTRHAERASGARRIEKQATAGMATEATQEEFYDWPASEEDDLGKVADEVSNHQDSSTPREFFPVPETPRKALKMEALTSPGKRRHEEIDAVGDRQGYATPTTGFSGDDVFAATAATTSTTTGISKGLFPTTRHSTNPVETPTPVRYKDASLGVDSELATEILTTLAAHDIGLPPDARNAVKGICDRHVLFTRGVIKGRDISRAVVKSKDEKVVEMKVEIEGLKTERETDRAVIRHLRREMAQRKEERT